MKGLVSRVDEAHQEKLNHIWQQLSGELAITYLSENMSYGHITYAGVDGCDRDQLVAGMQEVCREQEPFTMRTAGLGIFTGDYLVLYIAVARSPELSAFHRKVHQMTRILGAPQMSYYDPSAWMPHISIALNDLTMDNLPDTLRLLVGAEFAWDIQIDNLTYIDSQPPGTPATIEHETWFGKERE